MTEIMSDNGVNPDDGITAEAVEFLAQWALKQIPPLAVIAACDRALWWACRHLPNEKPEEDSDD